MLGSILKYLIAFAIAAVICRSISMKHAALLMALLCDASFTWASIRFFRRDAGSSIPIQRWAVRSAYATAVLHGVAILFGNHGTVYHFFAGVALYVLALMLFWWAVAATSGARLRLFFSNELPVGLVEHGPYRLVRHPFYAAYTLAWLAGAVITDQPLLLATVALNLAIYLRAASLEEAQFARSPLAGRHRRYRRRVGKLLPRFPTPVPTPAIELLVAPGGPARQPSQSG